MPVPVHAFKRIHMSLVANQKIILPQFFVEENGLQSAEVNVSHLDDLISSESKQELKVAFRLTRDKLHCTNNFE